MSVGRTLGEPHAGGSVGSAHAGPDMGRHGLLARMAALGAGLHQLTPTHMDELRRLTVALMEVAGDAPREEYERFVSVADRGLDLDTEALRAQLRGATVLVTGGTGCIGSRLIAELQPFEPARIVSLSRGLVPHPIELAGVEYHRVDLCDAASVRALLDEVRPEIVYHLAAQHDPGLAEREPRETIATNVFGTRNLLEAAAAAGVTTFVHASTGKTLRPYTPDVYAATKKIGEWLLAEAAERTELAVAGVRFTHVVDNSIVFDRLCRWTSSDEPVRLHGTEIHFYLQSAREAAHLVLNAGLSARRGRLTMQAIRDLGMPASLTDLALGVIDASERPGVLHFAGFESGYEETPYPCLYDPMTAGDVSPLISALESPETVPSPWCGEVDEFPLAIASTPPLVDGLVHLEEAWLMGTADAGLKERLQELGWDLLDARLAAAPECTIQRAATRAAKDRSVASSLPVHARTHAAIIRQATSA